MPRPVLGMWVIPACMCATFMCTVHVSHQHATCLCNMPTFHVCRLVHRYILACMLAYYKCMLGVRHFVPTCWCIAFCACMLVYSMLGLHAGIRHDGFACWSMTCCACMLDVTYARLHVISIHLRWHTTSTCWCRTCSTYMMTYCACMIECCPCMLAYSWSHALNDKCYHGVRQYAICRDGPDKKWCPQ